MPRQNRVTPFSSIIATPARGQWIGNRGCIHDENGHIRRMYQTRRWIVCLLQFKGRRRTLMQPGRWTELFFLDEATALAAGHRPCAYCQRARYEEFRAGWARANPSLVSHPKPSADVLDACLHRERLDATRQRITYLALLGTLPDATFVVHGEQACIVRESRLYPWQPEGYGAAIDLPPDTILSVLTPRSIVNTLAIGFAVQIDSSAG